jgi:hypothetical protein
MICELVLERLAFSELSVLYQMNMLRKSLLLLWLVNEAPDAKFPRQVCEIESEVLHNDGS